MTDRIRELMEQALELVEGEFGPLQLNEEKFAQLIVQECLHNMENCDGDLNFAIWKTKKEFGVE